MIPGINLLGLALTVIQAQEIVLYRATGRQQNAVGQWLPSYAPGIPVEGSWQPVDRSKYEMLGLDFSKKYYNFYTQESITAVQDNSSPDIATWGGRKFETVGDTPWKPLDGWMHALFIDVGPEE